MRLEVADFLRSKEHDIKIVPSGIGNSEVIQLARKEQRVLLTHDVHFSNILLYPPKQHSGIIRIKIHPPSVDKTIEALKYCYAMSNPKNLIRSYSSSKKMVSVSENNYIH